MASTLPRANNGMPFGKTFLARCLQMLRSRPLLRKTKRWATRQLSPRLFPQLACSKRSSLSLRLFNWRLVWRLPWDSCRVGLRRYRPMSPGARPSARRCSMWRRRGSATPISKPNTARHRHPSSMASMPRRSAQCRRRHRSQPGRLIRRRRSFMPSRPAPYSRTRLRRM